MFHTIVTLILGFTYLRTISSQNLNGIFLIHECECSSSKETCEPNGPFILNQKRSTLTVKYGSLQIGVGTLGNNQVDLYLNQNRCKGLWDGKNHIADLKCQHQAISSAPRKATYSFLFMIGILIMLV
ncbi:unnamed protein product [Rotaria socialis]